MSATMPAEPLPEDLLRTEFEVLTRRAGLAFAPDREPEMFKAFCALRDLMSALDQPWVWSEEPAAVLRLAAEG